MTHALMDSLEMNETVKSVIAEMDEVKPEVKQKFKDFYEGTWKTYNETANQLLVWNKINFDTCMNSEFLWPFFRFSHLRYIYANYM